MTPPASSAVRKAHEETARTLSALTHEDIVPRAAAMNLTGLAVVEIAGFRLTGYHDLRTWASAGKRRVQVTWYHTTEGEHVANLAEKVGAAECSLDLAPMMGGAVRSLRGCLTYWSGTNGTTTVRFFES